MVTLEMFEQIAVKIKVNCFKRSLFFLSRIILRNNVHRSTIALISIQNI